MMILMIAIQQSPHRAAVGLEGDGPSVNRRAIAVGFIQLEHGAVVDDVE